MIRRLRVTDPDLRRQLGGNYPKQGIKWEPKGFVVESPRLKSRIIDAEVQDEGLAAFEANPRQPMTYMVAGNPDDRDALYFAHYLMQLHKAAVKLPDIAYIPVLGTFEPLLAKDASPTMIVMTNLTIKSSNLKYEKVRDVVVTHRSVPIVIVVAGEDPISFAAARLHLACHAIAYPFAHIANSTQEVL